MGTQVTAAQALADLQDAVASLQGSVTDLQTADTAIDAAIAKLEAEVSSGSGVDPAAVEAAIAQLRAASNALKPVVDDLTSQATTINPPAVSVAISPTSATVAQGATQQFSATVSGDAKNAGVTWAVGDVSQGSVDQTGLYTPPTTPGGSGTVVATSVSDTSKSATASVSF